VHFDPTKSKFTIVILFIPLFLYSYLQKFFIKPTAIFLFLISILFPFINFFSFGSFHFSEIEFFKTYILYISSVLIHVFLIYSPLKRQVFDLGNSVFFVLIAILIIALLQFLGVLIFGNTFFYNIFRDFQYNNNSQVEVLTSGIIPRTQAFYLEPSYLAFVTITLICINLLNKNKIKFTFLLGGLIIFISGSRGGFLGYFLLITWYVYNNSVGKKFIYRFGYKILFFFIIGFFVVFSPFLTLLSSESLATENTSQYVRLFSGYELSNYVLAHYLFGIPLGSIEVAFSNFLGVENTSYSFFFLNIFYHGWFSFFILIFIIFSIFYLNIERKFKVLLFIYLLLYFNMTGSLLSPDTYFWFFCFYYIFKVKAIGAKKFSIV